MDAQDKEFRDKVALIMLQNYLTSDGVLNAQDDKIDILNDAKNLATAIYAYTGTIMAIRNGESVSVVSSDSNSPILKSLHHE